MEREQQRESEILDKIINELDPRESKIDRRILYELIGVKLGDEDYLADDTDSCDHDPNDDPLFLDTEWYEANGEDD